MNVHHSNYKDRLLGAKEMNAPLSRSKFGKKFDENFDRIFRKKEDAKVIETHNCYRCFDTGVVTKRDDELGYFEERCFCQPEVK